MSDDVVKSNRADDEHTVLYGKEGRVGYITLNRPHVLNALNARAHEELSEAWDDFEADDEVWVGVLSAAGDRAFSAGQDLTELAGAIQGGTGGPSTFGSRGEPGGPRFTDRFHLTKPVVAKVRGYALGGGFELALACDVIVASEDAVFGLPEVRLGLVPGAGGVFRLIRQVPYRVALGYLLTGRRMTAQRAYELGLVNEVVPAARLDEAVGSWVDDLLSAAPLSVRSVKDAVTRSAGMSLEEAFAASFPWEERRVRSADAREGALAFVERRPPRWTGT